jgi:SlyX protein
MSTSSPGTSAEARIEELEIRLAHQDQALQELGSEVYQQQQQIAALEQRIRELKDRLGQGENAAPAADAREEIPPHY